MGAIRFLLALAVFLNHLISYQPALGYPFIFEQFVSGLFAVQCFFIVSGFYMALVLNEKYTSSKDFYFNRAIKIYSTYYAVLFLGIFVAMAVGDHTVFSRIFNSGLTWGGKLLMFSANSFIIGSDWMMFFFPGPHGLEFTDNYELHTPLYAYHDMPQAWSLPLELMFYLVAPFIVKNKRRLFITGGISLACLYFTYVYFGQHDPWTCRFLPSELWAFCLGALAYHLYVKVRDFRFSKYAGVLFCPLMLLYIAKFYAIPVLFDDNAIISGQKLQLLLCVSISLPFIFLATKNNCFDNWLGNLSYPIYLVQHLVITRIAILPVITPAGTINALFYTIGLSIGIHYIIQYVIMRRYKRNPGHK